MITFFFTLFFIADVALIIYAIKTAKRYEPSKTSTTATAEEIEELFNQPAIKFNISETVGRVYFSHN